MAVNIDIQHKLAVRDGFVEIPDDPVHPATLTVDQVLTLIPGAVRRRQAFVASQIIDQEWIELPAFDRAATPDQDFYQILRDAVDLATI